MPTDFLIRALYLNLLDRQTHYVLWIKKHKCIITTEPSHTENIWEMTKLNHDSGVRLSWNSWLYAKSFYSMIFNFFLGLFWNLADWYGFVINASNYKRQHDSRRSILWAKGNVNALHTFDVSQDTKIKIICRLGISFQEFF